jgi:hypothetical protein
MSQYSPFFKYTLKPASANDPTPQCIKVPDDHSKCGYEEQRTKNRLAYEAPFNMKLYNDNKPMHYQEGVKSNGFPIGMDNSSPSCPACPMPSSYYPVTEFTNEKTPLHIIDKGNLQCSKPKFKKGIFNNYNTCDKMKVPCCQSTSTCTFNKCDQPDWRFGMSESIYKQYPEQYKEHQNYNGWKNLSSKEFIKNGDYKYITKQQWTSTPWSLERYAAPQECPDEHFEEWRTDKDRCHGEYKICHNLFNNMTRRKSIL